jgi:hypothetical protein
MMITMLRVHRGGARNAANRLWKEWAIIEESAIYSETETAAAREERIALLRSRILKINCYKLKMQWKRLEAL